MEKESKRISRRNFIQVAAASAAILAATGCTPQNQVVEGEKQKTYRLDDELNPDSQGRWITAACWHNCGGRCVNKAYVKDGIVIRQKTDDVEEDTFDNYQQRACPRGRSQRQQIFSDERLKYPMKRRSWKPGGSDVSGELRGVDEWERVSWDEAIGLVADELKRIYSTYGGRAVYYNGYAGVFWSNNLINCMGGKVCSTTSDSFGTWLQTSIVLGMGVSTAADGGPEYGPGSDGMGNPDTCTGNDRYDLPNAETIVLYGCNPAWASGGSPMYFLNRAKEAGVDFVYVGPSMNLSAQTLNARWIPVRNGMDIPFLLSVAYVMMRDDSETNPLIDWEFLDTYVQGFDIEHLPADAQVQECFKDYVLGAYDGIEKTPEWATEYCGTPVEDIEWYANYIGCKRKVMLLHAYAPGRAHGTEDMPQLFMAIGAMGGHMGKPGHATGGIYHAEAGNAGPRLVSWGADQILNMASFANPITDMLGGAKLWQSILDKRYWYHGTSSTALYSNLYSSRVESGEWRDIDIKLIFNHGGNFLHSRPDINNGIKAFRAMETVIGIFYDFCPTAQYCDILLPACTNWEDPAPLTNMYGTQTWMNKETLFLPQQIVEPMYEALPEFEIACRLCDATGIERSQVLSVETEEQYCLNLIRNATVRNADTLQPEPLVIIDEEGLAVFKERVGEATCDLQAEGHITLKDFLEKGFYHIPRKEGDKYTFIGYKAYVDDPVNHPRPSASGKLEIYSDAKANVLNLPGYDKNRIFKPYPTYYDAASGYVQTFSDWKNKVKGEYPYVVYNPHYIRRSHTTLDNLPWLREALTNPVYINASDAKTLGIADGDTVLISNQYGQVLRNASVIESIMPGCVGLPHGGWPKIDPNTGIDHGGSDNILLGPIEQPSLMLGAYNTVMVKLEKWTGTVLPADCDASPVNNMPVLN